MIVRHRVRTTPAQATVDDLGLCLDKGDWRYFRVIVRTGPGFSPVARRVYELRAHDDTMAAREGLQRFSEELDYVTITV